MGWPTFLIDDDEISAFLTKHMLQLQHFSDDITIFYQAGDALQYLLENMVGELPAVILLDLNMPLVSGWDFLEALNPYVSLLLTKCKVFILTSSLDEADQLKSREYALVSGFMQKPIRAEDIQFIRAEMSKG